MSVNSAYLTVEKSAHLLGGMLLMVGVARLMGASGLANYTFAISLTAFFVPILDVGLNNRVIKAVAGGDTPGRAAAVDAVALKLALAPAALAAMGAVAWTSGKPLVVVLTVLLVGGSTVAMSLGDAVNAVFKGLQRPVFSAMLVGGLNVILLGTGLGTMAAGFGLLGIGACYFACRSGYLGAGLRLMDRVAPEFRPPFRPALRRTLFLQGLQYLPAPYFLGNLLHLNFITTDLALSEVESARYAIGYRLAAALFVLAGASLEAILPAWTRRFQETAELRGAFFRTAGTLLGITLAGVAVVQVVARPAVTLVFGPEYAPAAAAVRLLVWCVPPFVLCGMAHTALLATDRQVYGALVLLAMLVAGSGFGVVAMHFWGAPGTALVPTVTGWVFAAILWGMALRKSVSGQRAKGREPRPTVR